MYGAGLNLPGKIQIIKIDRTAILNNDGMVACGFWDKMFEVHVTQSSQRKG